MPSTLKLADVAVNAAVDAQTALLNGGKLRLYDGAQPANADAAVTTQHLLAELDFASSAFAGAADGVAAANAIAKETDAPYAGTNTAAWFRCVKSNGDSVLDGSVGTAGCDLNLPAVAITQHQEVAVDSFSITAPQSA